MPMGVLQHSPPEGVIVSQLPPVVVDGVALKVKFVPVLATPTTCGSGFAPPATVVNDSAGTVWKVCADATEVPAANSSTTAKAAHVFNKNREDGIIPLRA